MRSNDILIVDSVIVERCDGLDETVDGGVIRTSGLYCVLRGGEIVFDRSAAIWRIGR